MNGFPAALWELARTAGPFGAVLGLVMWWLERADRIKLQRERDGLLERVLIALHGGTQAIEEATRVINLTTQIRRR